ncbi:hypothetical protein [Burkholderia sp. Ax-1719]|uniref:hypothetical protein n=1 Tax=Burkholderia sp. Ax-1719 TaxID=2608334 RepID=UPI001F0390FC|nr:hypothetical protein [Burkholderia sp. Ax-1719]
MNDCSLLRGGLLKRFSSNRINLRIKLLARRINRLLGELAERFGGVAKSGKGRIKRREIRCGPSGRILRETICESLGTFLLRFGLRVSGLRQFRLGMRSDVEKLTTVRQSLCGGLLRSADMMREQFDRTGGLQRALERRFVFGQHGARSLEIQRDNGFDALKSRLRKCEKSRDAGLIMCPEMFGCEIVRGLGHRLCLMVRNAKQID